MEVLLRLGHSSRAEEKDTCVSRSLLVWFIQKNLRYQQGWRACCSDSCSLASLSGSTEHQWVRGWDPWVVPAVWLLCVLESSAEWGAGRTRAWQGGCALPQEGVWAGAPNRLPWPQRERTPVFWTRLSGRGCTESHPACWLWVSLGFSPLGRWTSRRGLGPEAGLELPYQLSPWTQWQRPGFSHGSSCVPITTARKLVTKWPSWVPSNEEENSAAEAQTETWAHTQRSFLAGRMNRQPTAVCHSHGTVERRGTGISRGGQLPLNKCAAQYVWPGVQVKMHCGFLGGT